MLHKVVLDCVLNFESLKTRPVYLLALLEMNDYTCTYVA